MVDIQSKEVIDKISDELKVQPALQIPRALAEKIQLVYGVNPILKGQIASVSRTATGSATIFTTSTTKRTFITAMMLQNQSDVAADNTSVYINAIPRGKAGINFLQFKKIPLTILSGNESLTFHPPIELEKGSVVTINSVFTVGVSNSFGVVSYFETDPQ